MTTKTEKATDFDKALLKAYPEMNFLQSPIWGQVNLQVGHTLANFVDPEHMIGCQMIVKSAKRGRYLEVPGGPLLDWQDAKVVSETFAEIKRTAREHHCAFVRLRPQLLNTPKNLQILHAEGAKPAPMHLHAEHTVMLDLTKNESELLSAMRRQTRYEVRRAERLGITVEWSNSKDAFSTFHDVQLETAARQHFVPPSMAMLMAEREAFGDQARIYVAKTESGEPIAFGLIFWYGEEAEYFEAASTNLNQKLPGSYALLWQAMRDLKGLGLKRFNLWGIAPTGQKQHRYAGVTTFKTGFGGEIVEFVPAHDIVIHPLRYKLNWCIETIRKKKRHL